MDAESVKTAVSCHCFRSFFFRWRLLQNFKVILANYCVYLHLKNLLATSFLNHRKIENPDSFWICLHTGFQTSPNIIKWNENLRFSQPYNSRVWNFKEEKGIKYSKTHLHFYVRIRSPDIPFVFSLLFLLMLAAVPLYHFAFQGNDSWDWAISLTICGPYSNL